MGTDRPATTPWQPLRYADWSATCDTLHAHTQVLGKLAAALAPPEPQLQHAALRLTARGWETAPLPTANGAGTVTVALDLRRHEALVEHSGGDGTAIPLGPDRAVGAVCRELLDAVRRVGGPVEIDPTPQEVSWTVPLDEDDQHRTYDAPAVERYFAAATEAAIALTTFVAPFRGRRTPINAWWGSFDLAVNLFSGAEAAPPADDFIMRNAMDAQEVAIGWWPGDENYGQAAFYAYAHPAPEGFSAAKLDPAAARWDDALGEFILDWEDVRTADDPRATAVEFAHSVFQHSCAVCGWDDALAASAAGTPPPIR